jgi:hypothetical protein
MREVRRLTRLLLGSWVLFVVLPILNGTAVQLGWYCGVCR